MKDFALQIGVITTTRKESRIQNPLGADPFIKDNSGKTALDYAIEKKDLDYIDVLTKAMKK